MNSAIMPPIRHFLQLYTLHQVERPETGAAGDSAVWPAADWLIVRVRVETVRYSFAPLASLAIQPVYTRDPRAGVALARQAVAPRLQTLLEARDPFRELNLLGDRADHWQRYAAARGLPAEPVRVPVIHLGDPARQAALRPGPASAHPLSARLARLHQALALFQTAAETAATLAGAWQHWQLGRERRRLIDAQRALLHDAIQAQMRGQAHAFDRALDGDFVRGYLDDHAGDAGYAGLFGETDDPPDAG